MNIESLLLVFVIVLLGVLLVEVLSRIVIQSKELVEPPKLPCNLHAWVLNHKEEMICGECNMRSGL